MGPCQHNLFKNLGKTLLPSMTTTFQSLQLPAQPGDAYLSTGHKVLADLSQGHGTILSSIKRIAGMRVPGQLFPNALFLFNDIIPSLLSQQLPLPQVHNKHNIEA